MKLKKKELVISIVMIIISLFIGLNLSAFAATGSQTVSFPSLNQNTDDTMGNLITINTSTPTQNTSNVTTNTNTTQTVPDTGLEELPWLIIGICVVSAIFAYKKIKDYNID